MNKSFLKNTDGIRPFTELQIEKIIKTLMNSKNKPIHVSALGREVGLTKSGVNYYLIGSKKPDRTYGGFLKPVIDKTYAKFPNKLTFVKLKPEFIKEITNGR